ncbi:MAG: polysaccharide deacetylase family protein, partial [Robiginitalea sp.]
MKIEIRSIILSLLFVFILLIGLYTLNAQGSASKGNNIKYIYLTFDDGPLEGSEKIDEAIRYEKVPITVLLVGRHAEGQPHY